MSSKKICDIELELWKKRNELADIRREASIERRLRNPLATSDVATFAYRVHFTKDQKRAIETLETEISSLEATKEKTLGTAVRKLTAIADEFGVGIDAEDFVNLLGGGW